MSKVSSALVNVSDEFGRRWILTAPPDGCWKLEERANVAYGVIKVSKKQFYEREKSFPLGSLNLRMWKWRRVHWVFFQCCYNIVKGTILRWAGCGRARGGGRSIGLGSRKQEIVWILSSFVVLSEGGKVNIFFKSKKTLQESWRRNMFSSMNDVIENS